MITYANISLSLLTKMIGRTFWQLILGISHDMNFDKWTTEISPELATARKWLSNAQFEHDLQSTLLDHSIAMDSDVCGMAIDREYDMYGTQRFVQYYTIREQIIAIEVRRAQHYVHYIQQKEIQALNNSPTDTYEFVFDQD
jgi:hypothetical protein